VWRLATFTANTTQINFFNRALFCSANLLCVEHWRDNLQFYPFQLWWKEAGPPHSENLCFRDTLF